MIDVWPVYPATCYYLLAKCHHLLVPFCVNHAGVIEVIEQWEKEEGVPFDEVLKKAQTDHVAALKFLAFTPMYLLRDRSLVF